jgi:predicted ester cyclase
MQVTVHDTLAQGDQVVARWTATMTHTGPFMGLAATGRKAKVTGMSIQRIIDGKIVEGWDNWDQLGLLVQIGAVPAAQFAPPKPARRAGK